jgi:hypothetical protein
MRRRTIPPSLTLLLGALAAGACGGSAGAGRYPTAKEGRIVVEWRGGPRLMDAAAWATYCAADSLLVIIAVDRSWGAGLVLHGRFPGASVRGFTVRPSVGEDGTAAAAFRAVTDSVQRAVMALRGTVWLDAGSRATGRFDVGAAPLPGRSDPVHLVGAFRGLPTTDTATTCSAWSRTP